jgi:hypothetical protein
MKILILGLVLFGAQINAQLFGNLIPQLPGLSGFGNLFGGNNNPNTFGGQVNSPFGSGSAQGQVSLPNNMNFVKTFTNLAGNFSQQINDGINEMLNNINSIFSGTPIAPFVQAGIQAAQSAIQQFGNAGKTFANILDPLNIFHQDQSNPLGNFAQGIANIGQNVAQGFGFPNIFNSSGSGLPNLFGGNSPFPGFPNIFNTSIFPGLPNPSSILSNFTNPAKFFSSLPNLNNFLPNLNNQSLPDSLKQQLQNAIQQYGSAANLSALQAISQIQKSFANLQNSSQPIINAINDMASYRIQDIQQGLQSLNSTIQKCVNNSGINPQQGIETARNESVKCVQNKMDDGMKIAQNAVSNVQNAYQNMQNVSTALQNCSSYSVNVSTNAMPSFQSAKLGCYGSALLDINSDTILLPLEVAKTVSDADTYMQSLKGYALKCAAQAGYKISQQYLETMRVIAKCMMNN